MMSGSKLRAVIVAVAAVLIAAIIAGCAGTGGKSVSDARVARLMAHYDAWYGTPYRYGGTSQRGVDCSGFVQETMRRVFDVNVPRSTEDQARSGRRVGRSSLASGDLVFFKTGWFKYHVGVYVGNGRFIHASESKGVIQSSLSSPYWSERFWKARRVV